MFNTVRLSSDERLYIIDQTLLPGHVEEIELITLEDICDAILHLKVRGAPAIGVCAAYGIYLLAKHGLTGEALLHAIEKVADVRPTAVNLRYAASRMADVVRRADTEELLPMLKAEACAIDAAEAEMSAAIGEHGVSLIKPGMGVLTHCNAGALATTGPGTALAPLYAALQREIPFTVYCDETRPLLQGARLTAWEMQQAGADTVLLCDNMAASLMAAGKIQLVLVGADRIAANGDAANKIGTMSVAVLAAHFHVPFYVCAPASTIDLNCADGGDIQIEQRPAEEVTSCWYAAPMAPEGISVYNPAFDVTPAQLISGIITEKGILYPPFCLKA